MIHIMPFTHLSERYISRVAAAVGSFTVCQVAEPMLSANMRQWISRGVVCPAYAGGLNSDHLLKAVDEFSQWGTIHEGRLSAMAGLFASDQDRLLLRDENAPTRLSYLIRQYENQDSDSQADATFRAALFLAMAQIYDEQQDIVSGTLAGVQRMEMEMASQLAGDHSELPGPISEVSSDWMSGAQDRGLLLTDQRIVAWATLAASAEYKAHLYLTTSLAVFTAVMDQLSEAIQVGQWTIPLNRLDREFAVVPEKSQLDIALETMAAAADPLNMATDLGTMDRDLESDSKGTAKMAIAVLPGRKPHQVLSDLSGGAVPDQPVVDGVSNTMFGHLVI